MSHMIQINQSKMRNAKLKKLGVHAVMLIISFFMLVPFVWMLSSSFKPENDVFKMPIEWIPKQVTMSNYKAIFSGEFNFTMFYKNSLLVAVTVTLLQLITCSLAGYAFSKITFPGRDKIFLSYLGTMMVPFQVTMIPLFIILRNLHLIDSLGSLIIIGAFSTYGVFLLRQFYMGIPGELSEAAIIDGASHWQIYLRIMLPNLKPALATLTLFTFLGQWNDFLPPFVFLNSRSKMTIPLGLKAFATEYNVEFGKIMAGTTIAIIPILILFLCVQKYFIEGVAHTGVKG